MFKMVRKFISALNMKNKKKNEGYHTTNNCFILLQFVFAAILAFACAVPAPEPKPQVLIADGVPVVSSVYSAGVVPIGATYTATGVVSPYIAPGVVVV